MNKFKRTLAVLLTSAILVMPLSLCSCGNANSGGATEVTTDITVTDLMKNDTDLYAIQSSENSENGMNMSSSKMNGGELLESEDINGIKKNKHLAFRANIENFESITVGHGKHSYDGHYITIDGENIYHYATDVSTKLMGTYAHGLTFKNFIYILIDVDSVCNAAITVIGDSGSFTKKDILWNGSNGKIFAESNGSTLINAELSWTSEDYKTPIWLFGDSYFNTSAPDRWTYYLTEWGFENNLHDGWNGRVSADAVECLKANLKHGTPEYVVWCMGMNDPDGTSEINANWLSATEEVAEICKNNGIELILATIPNVSGGYSKDNPQIPAAFRNNSFKSQWVKDSGYRYIDFEKAVGANEKGFWYGGMLDKDGVHPTALGAQALALQVLVDFPEIMKKAK